MQGTTVHWTSRHTLGTMTTSLGYLPVVLATLLLASASSDSDLKNMEKYRVVPDIIPVVPPAEVTVEYGDLSVQQGNELTPTQVHGRPTKVSWPVEENGYYTLIMNDPDIPAFVGAKEVQHWVVVNIPGNDISKGETLFDYVGSGPPEGSGLHRYIFLAYKQPGKLDKTKYEDIQDVKEESRRSYILNDLVKRFDLGNAVAGNFYRAQYDENVPKYHAERKNKYGKKD